MAVTVRHAILKTKRSDDWFGVRRPGMPTRLSTYRSTRMPADRHLLFALLALLNGFIRQDQLVVAFHAWTTDKSRPLADHLVALGHLDDARRAAIEALVALNVETHGDPEQSLATLSISTVTLDQLREISDPVMSASLAGIGRRLIDGASGRTVTFTVGAVTTDGQRFRVLRHHARGGLGVVFVALDTELNREVALKQILDDRADNPTSRRRFLLEAEITGRLEHPGIVPVYGLGSYGDGRPYYVMRFIRGDSLKEAIDRCHADEAMKPDADRRSLELHKLLRRFTDVCNAIEYAHTRGVIHRDIKPGNIVIGEHGETLVVDWGLAKPLGRVDSGPQSGERVLVPSAAGPSAETLPGEAMGTPAYMSPEQAEGNLEALGPRSDVYSLGATLYYLLTGKAPLEGDDLGALLRAAQKGDFPWPRRVEPLTDRALEAVCLKAMALKPEDRYSTSRALADDVERWLADQPVLAYAEPFWTRASRQVRRHKPWVAAAGVLLILIAAVLAIYNRQILREKGKTADQLAMTRDALRELLKVSGENLALVPHTERLREYLAQLVLDRYQRLGERFPTDQGVRLETAQVLRVIAGIGRITGKYSRSQASYDQAIEVMTSLCEDEPAQANYRRWLVETYVDRGELNHMSGRTSEAEADFRAAIGQANKLRVLPVPPSFRRAKASALINLSEVLMLKEQYAEAREAADGAVALLRPLAGAVPTSDLTARDRWLLCMALADRAVASGRAGRLDPALRDFDEAERVASQIPRDEEPYDDAQFQIACISNQRGELLKDVSRLSESERNYEQAAGILERLIKDHALILHYREEMAVTSSGRAAARLSMGRIADAQRDCQTALDHLALLVGEQARKGAPENPGYLSLLGQTRALEGRIYRGQGRVIEGRKAMAEAAESLERALRIDPARATVKVLLDRIKADSDR
jgi:serine/threonine protein kinase